MRCPLRSARRRVRLHLLLFAASILLLPACDVLFRPQLAVTPLIVEFPAQTGIRSIRVTNVGAEGSLLRWGATGSARLTVWPSGGTLRAGEGADVWLSVDRSDLTETTLVTAQVAGAGQVAEVTAIVDPSDGFTPAACDPDPAVRYAGVTPMPLEAAIDAFAAAGVAPTGVRISWGAVATTTAHVDVREVATRIPAAAAALVTGIVPLEGGAWLPSTDPLSLARLLAAEPSIQWVELDGPIVRTTATTGPDDPRYVSGEQWYLDAFGFASGRLEPGAGYVDDVVVAVIDTGLRASHEDLLGRTAPGRSFHSSATSLDVGDTSGHGTHVSGLIAAAEGNGVGIVGLAAHVDVRVQPIKVFSDAGDARIGDLVRAIRWAAGLFVGAGVPPNDTRVDVINMSLGTSVYSSDLRRAVIDARCAGVLLVAAAGNGVDQVGVDGGVDYPAAHPEVLSVGSVDADMKRSRFSDFGEGLVDLMAPGGYPLPGSDVCARQLGGILSTYRGEDDAYSCLSGTSMAAPLVAASAAVLIASDPHRYRGHPAAVETALREAAERKPGPSPAEYGFGVLCLDALLGTATVCGAAR